MSSRADDHELTQEPRDLVDLLAACHRATGSLGGSQQNIRVIRRLARLHLSILGVPWMIAEGIRVARTYKTSEYQWQKEAFLDRYQEIVAEDPTHGERVLDLMLVQLPARYAVEERFASDPDRAVVPAVRAVVDRHLRAGQPSTTDNSLDEIWRLGDLIASTNIGSGRPRGTVPPVSAKEARAYASQRDQLWFAWLTSQPDQIE